MAMKPTIGAFHDGASRRSTRSTRVTPRASIGKRLVVSVFFRDAICRRRAAGSCRSLRLDPLHRIGPKILTRHLEIVVRLKIQPELRTVAEIQPQPQRGVGSYP